jgi:hypothetical protein
MIAGQQEYMLRGRINHHFIRLDRCTGRGGIEFTVQASQSHLETRYWSNGCRGLAGRPAAADDSLMTALL